MTLWLLFYFLSPVSVPIPDKPQPPSPQAMMMPARDCGIFNNANEKMLDCFRLAISEGVAVVVHDKDDPSHALVFFVKK